MPVPLVTESLSKGIIDATMLPWEVAPTLKVHEVARFHSETPPGVPMLSNNRFRLRHEPGAIRQPSSRAETRHRCQQRG
ncbi:MAG: hypothetical protein OSW71_16270 [Proteobacteria bacterium]|nr:hypothetical protein [Pseudomonadota bacterium]